MRSLIVFSLVVILNIVLCEECFENEKYFPCGDSCQTKCSTLGEPCNIRHIRCPDGCYCVEGYARNETGNCIPIAECPKNPTVQIGNSNSDSVNS